MQILQDHTIRIENVETCYWREGSGPPLLLLHGIGGSAAGWLTTLPALIPTHEVLAPDLPGFGRTEPLQTGPTCMGDSARFVHDFMQALNIGQADVMGHSMGAAIALQLAIEFPESVRRLVLVDSSGLGRSISPLFRLMSVPLLGEALARSAYTPDVHKFIENTRAGVKNPAILTDELLETLFRIEQSPERYKITLKTLRIGVNLAGQKRSFVDPILQGLPTLTQPVLLVWGRQDPHIPLEHAEAALRRLPNARLEVIDACGHIPMFDQPEAFNRIVSEFLQ